MTCCFFSLVSSRSQPVSWALLSLAPWAHPSSTATTCRWSTRLRWWVLAQARGLPLQWQEKPPLCFRRGLRPDRQHMQTHPGAGAPLLCSSGTKQINTVHPGMLEMGGHARAWWRPGWMVSMVSAEKLGDRTMERTGKKQIQTQENYLMYHPLRNIILPLLWWQNK